MAMVGIWCKNLFLKDSRGKFLLIVALADMRIELKKIAKALQAPKLRFAEEEQLINYLGLAKMPSPILD